MPKMTDLIREYQNIHGLSDRKLAQLVGLNHSTISRIKKGNRGIGIKARNALLGLPDFNRNVYDRPHSQILGALLRFLGGLVK